MRAMLAIRRKINLFYYNIFRFERYTQRLVSGALYGGVKSTSLARLMEERTGKEDWDQYFVSVLNGARGGISLSFAGLQVGAHLLVILMSFWNFVCGWLRLGIDPFWKYGWIASVILAVVLSYYAAPIDTQKYLADFRKFELMPKSDKRKSAGLTFLIIIGIWLTFIGSLIYYMRSIIT